GSARVVSERAVPTFFPCTEATRLRAPIERSRTNGNWGEHHSDRSGGRARVRGTRLVERFQPAHDRLDPARGRRLRRTALAHLLVELGRRWRTRWSPSRGHPRGLLGPAGSLLESPASAGLFASLMRRDPPHGPVGEE